MNDHVDPLISSALAPFAPKGEAPSDRLEMELRQAWNDGYAVASDDMRRQIAGHPDQRALTIAGRNRYVDCALKRLAGHDYFRTATDSFLIAEIKRRGWKLDSQRQAELEAELRDIERWMAASIELTPHARLDWLQAFSEVWLPRIRAALSAPPPPEPRQFPVQQYGLIPWHVAERAYEVYARKFGRQQSLERLAERGGFGVEEMDLFAPGWRTPPPEPVVRWCVKGPGGLDVSSLFATREEAEHVLAYTSTRWGVDNSARSAARVEIVERPE